MTSQLFKPATSLPASLILPAFTKHLKEPELFRNTNYINGEWVTPVRDSTFEVRDPTTNEVVGHCPDVNVEETKVAIQAAHDSRISWGKTSAKVRSDLLRKLYDLMMVHADDLAKIISIENGKPLADAKGEITYAASFFDWFSAEAVRSYGDVIPANTDGLRNIVIRQPIGVCSILACWNFPSVMPLRKASAAIAAGCTMVIKAPPETPFSGLAFARLVELAGFPAGVVNVITTSANTPAVGKEMTQNPLIRKVTFTGSTGVGKLLAEQSASTLKKVSLELGGNAIFAVFPDADLPSAIEGLIACKFRLSGQTCVCCNRVFIHNDIYEEFTELLVARVKKFKLGAPFDPSTTHGPLIHQRSMDKVDAHVQDAIAHGSKLVLGGKRATLEGPLANGFFYEPTILTEVPTSGVALNQEETFGPVCPLSRFDSEDELLKIANDTEVGLAGYFYTKDLARAFRFGEALECGMVGINTGLISQACIPFGGVKQSGYGREGSKYGLQEFQTMKLMAMSIN